MDFPFLLILFLNLWCCTGANSAYLISETQEEFNVKKAYYKYLNYKMFTFISPRSAPTICCAAQIKEAGLKTEEKCHEIHLQS